ncbi:hypothetical protein QN277_008296 [Acacia crassicarpa]|uniref:GIR1-like zinc ribbon domain-containing protein n=1 Tax=Acacia crassicarpa TaxID=499986 RepID=A0AAE1MCX8_9FABA|nr:hypothetical protein QN277_008296 [Acacia crassicarpa]
MEAEKRGRSSPRLDLRLNLSPVNSSSSEILTSSSSNNLSEMTVEESSCVSWEAEEERVETKAMLLVGCRRCLMYVLLSDVDPKCPKCNSTVLLDFLSDDASSSAAVPKPNN